MMDIDVLVTSDKTAPPFDTYAPLLSLPRIMGTTIETIPSYSSYLTAPSELDNILDRILRTRLQCLKVGIVWAGNPNHVNDHNRSCHQEHFSRLGNITNVQLFSLQKGKEGEKTITDHLQNEILDLSPHLDDFAVTAAVIDRLDLVIAVDTAVVHLAGALGKKTWVLLPFSPDWRWLSKGNTSVWYPSLRLFRQHRSGDWQTVFDRVAEELQVL
jgi:hypothetical protein